MRGGRVLLGMGLLETVLAFAQVLTGQGNAWWRKGSRRECCHPALGRGFLRSPAQLDLATGAHAPSPSPPPGCWVFTVLKRGPPARTGGSDRVLQSSLQGHTVPLLPHPAGYKRVIKARPDPGERMGLPLPKGWWPTTLQRSMWDRGRLLQPTLGNTVCHGRGWPLAAAKMANSVLHGLSLRCL